jgi:hypothetical protein
MPPVLVRPSRAAVPRRAGAAAGRPGLVELLLSVGLVVLVPLSSPSAGRRNGSRCCRSSWCYGNRASIRLAGS